MVIVKGQDRDRDREQATPDVMFLCRDKFSTGVSKK